MEPYFKLDQEVRPRYFLLKIDGYLSAKNILALRSVFEEVLRKHDTVALDLSGVQFIDSMGIGILVNFYKQVKKKAGRLGIFNLSDTARDIFEVSDMDKWLPIHGTEADPDTVFN